VKLLLLIILMNYPFGGLCDIPVTQQVVDSPKEAAVLLWKTDQDTKGQIEPPGFIGYLYEVDLSVMTVKEVPIPTIQFIKGETE